MTVQAANNLQRFYNFVGEHLNNDGARLSPEQVFALWRERLETVEAIGKGMEDVQAGRVISLEEFDRKFRQKHNLPEDV